MIINLRQLHDGQDDVTAQKRIDLNELLTMQHDILHVDEISVRYRIDVSGDKYILRGHGDTVARFACARCLCHFEQQMHIPFEEVFSYNEAVGEEDEDVIILTESVVDLEQHIAENLILGFPFIPLCKEDCLGLCAVCGTDRNIESCNCNTERIDPRFEALRVLLEESES